MLPIKLGRVVIVATLSIILCSCGGSGGSTPAPAPAPAPTPTPTPTPDSNVERYYREAFQNEYDTSSWGAVVIVAFSGFNIEGLKYYNSDRTFGVTEHSPHRDFDSREGVTTYFHLGSIEFFPVTSSIQLSIFHLLRNHNHRSNEVINLTRLLMLLDENDSQSHVITLSQGAHDLVSSSELELSDLYIDINLFEGSGKIASLLDNLDDNRLPGIQDAEEYLLEHFGKWIGSDGYAQWPAGFEIDFDNDGALNEVDAFPWDATQWQDENNDREGDSSQVTDLFIDTNGVLEYEVDALNGFLYIAAYNKKLHKYGLESGQHLSTIEFENFITCIEVNSVNGDVYIGLTSEYSVYDYIDLENQNGSIARINHNSDDAEELLDIESYPVDIKLHKNEYLYISTKNINSRDARLLRANVDLESTIEVLEYRGDGGKVILGEEKLITIDFNSYAVIDILERFDFLAEGSLDGFFNDPLFILDEYDALIDRHGTGFRMSLASGESWIRDYGTQYIDFGYYDIRGLAAGRRINDVIKDNTTNQYIAMNGSEAVYINSTTLLPHKTLRFNDYVSDINGAVNYHKFKLAKHNNNVFFITSKRDGTTHIAFIEDQCVSCYSSEPPVAVVQSLSPDLTVQDEIVLDASLSFDGEDVDGLVYRWDFNGDGKWDTEFVNQSTHPVKYELPGEKRVLVQVMDTSGLSDESEVSLNLNYGLNYGEEPASRYLKDITLLIDDVFFDRENNKIYLSSSDTGQFFILNSVTGYIEKVFNFRYLPTHMDMSDDGSILYLGLRGTGCQFSIVDCTDDLIDINDGIIIKFDTERQAFFDGFDVDVSPADIKVDGNQLYVTANTLYNSRNEFKSSVSVYDVNTTEKIRDLAFGVGNYGEFSNLLLVETPPGSDECLASIGGIMEYCDNDVYILHERSYYKSKYWLLPNTLIAINNAQNIYNIETFTENGSLLPRMPSGFSVSDTSIDSNNNLLVVGYSGISHDDGGLLRYFDLSSLEFLAEQYRDEFSDWIFTQDNRVIEVARLGNYQYEVNIIDYPCFSCN